jgi:carboxyl-terminal processing protease
MRVRRFMVWCLSCVATIMIGASAGDPARAEAPPAVLAMPSMPGPAALNFGDLLERVAATVAQNFHDEQILRRVDWPARVAEAREEIVAAPTLAEAARRINMLLGVLATSHTNFYTPDDPEYYILLDVVGGEGVKALVQNRFWGGSPAYAGIGAFTTELGGRHFVDAVLDGSPAARAGLAYGHEIVTVDGDAYHPIVSFRGKSGRDATVRIRRHAETMLETLTIPVVMLQPRKAFADAAAASARMIERGNRKIGYVRMWASVDADVLRDALDRLLPGPERPRGATTARRLADGIDALVLDMRGKVGGFASVPAAMLDVIDPPERRIAIRTTTARDGYGGSGVRTLAGRITVLTDRRTRSAAEIFVHGFKRAKLGPVVGSTTAGAVTASRAYVMPGETLLYLAIRGLEIDGMTLEGKGVEPDVRVEKPLPYADGADPVLEAALAGAAGK